MKRALFLSAVLLTLPVTASANINDAQTCQAMIEFTSQRVGDVKGYSRGDVKTVQKGLKAYDAFLQSEHVTPGLKTLTKGDKGAMKTYQTQIDAYKETLVKGLDARFAKGKIYSDQAMALNNCYTKMPMSEKQKPMMTKALETIIALAQS